MKTGRKPRGRFTRRATCLLWALMTLTATAALADFDLSDEVPLRDFQHPRFEANSGTRLGPRGPEIVLAFEVPFSELFFRPVGDRFHTEFDLIMVLYHDGRQVGGDLWPESLELDRREETESRTRTIRRQIVLPVRPGRYAAEVIVRESKAGRENRREWEIEVPKYAKEALSLSSIWIAACPDSLPDTGPEEVPAPPPDWILRPRISEALGPICFLGEAYRPGPSDDPVRIAWRIVGARREEVGRGELTLTAAARMPYRIAPALTSLWLGDYTIEVEASDGRHRARRTFVFQIAESMGAIESDLSQSLDLIALIATSEELRTLKETPPDQLRAAWDRFWEAHDPTPGTPENEFKDQFFARVRYANEHFSVLEPGWRSDRGRTYIQYGPPDSIESYPYNVDTPPYEIWIYNRLGKRFVFMDYDGFGKYEFYRPGRL